MKLGVLARFGSISQFIWQTVDTWINNCVRLLDITQSDLFILSCRLFWQRSPYSHIVSTGRCRFSNAASSHESNQRDVGSSALGDDQRAAVIVGHEYRQQLGRLRIAHILRKQVESAQRFEPGIARLVGPDGASGQL